MKERDHFAELYADGRIILRGILNEIGCEDLDCI
jgi:hypothetical protein